MANGREEILAELDMVLDGLQRADARVARVGGEAFSTAGITQLAILEAERLRAKVRELDKRAAQYLAKSQGA